MQRTEPSEPSSVKDLQEEIPVSVNGPHESPVPSPYKLLLILTAIIFTVEISLMSLLHYYTPENPLLSTLLDSTLLTIIMVPILYLFICRPMIKVLTHSRLNEVALERFKELIDSSNDALVIINADSGSIMDVNNTVVETLGYTREELLNMKAVDIQAAGKAGFDWEKNLLKLRQSKTMLMEVEVKRKDGSSIPVEASCNLIRQGKRSSIVAIVRDISERKKVEKDLEKSRESLVEAQKLARLGNWDWDIVNNNLAWSDEIYRIFELDPKEFGATYEAFLNEVHPEDREGVMKAVDRALYEGEQYSIDHRIVTPASNEKIVHEQSEVIYDKDNKPLRMIGTVQDVTEERLTQKRVESQLAKLEGLRFIDTTINASLDLKHTLDIVLKVVADLLDVDAADILLYKPNLKRLTFAGGTGFTTEALKHSNLKLGEGYASKAVIEEKMVHIPDINKDGENLFKDSKDFRKEGFTSYFGAPLIAKGEVKGVLEIFMKSEPKGKDDWIDFYETLAGQTAIALDNALMYDTLKHSNLNLLNAYDSTLEGWTKALDMRDKETEGHSQRVAEMTLAVAATMGIEEGTLADLRRGALLHDIGKIGIPDSILHKPGPLNVEEWKVMYKHPELAFEMLFPIEFLRSAIDIPYCHHEKIDGTGYPRGLKGDNIPIGARIFAAVDIFDALTSVRPYRPAWSKEKAMEHIKSLSGTHLDNEIVDIFCKTFDK